MARRWLCPGCGRTGVPVAQSVGVCKVCVLSGAADKATESHTSFRVRVGLPPIAPRGGRLRCGICVNECELNEGERGFCGVRVNKGGSMTSLAGPKSVLAYLYYDPIPTNCVAAEYCPATTGVGYPRFAVAPDGERGYYNLAIFLYGCNLDCLFCQNIQHKLALAQRKVPADFVVREEEFLKYSLDDRVTCLCFFGGDPTPQTPESLYLSKRVLEEAGSRGRIKRICWETNGLSDPGIMRAMGELSLRSGGIVKIDWKAWSPRVYEALTGVNGEKALERLKSNTRLLAKMMEERPEVPLLVVSTLLVPGYVDEEEVEGIATHLAQLSEQIPLVLLAFYPQHLMPDLPTTSFAHATSCYLAARRAGLRNITIGNHWLLSEGVY